MKAPVVILLLVIVLTSCTKADNDNSLNGHTIVEGQLLDAATLEPIAAGIVIIEYGNHRMDTVTDFNGDYRFDFVHKDKYAYYVTATANKYFGNDNVGIWATSYPNGKPSPVQRIELDKVNQTDIKLPPEGFVEYHLKQIKPFNGNIEVRILPYNSLTVISYNGQGLDKYYIDRLPGGTYHRIGCSIIRNNDSLQSLTDTLFVPRFDTLHYSIEF